MENSTTDWWLFGATIGTGVIMLLTLVFFFFQNRTQNKRLQRSIESSTYHNLAQNESSWLKVFVEHPELESIVYKEKFEDSKIETQAYWLSMAILTNYENVCEQQQKFNLVGSEWESWEYSIIYDLQHFSYLRGIVKENPGFFPRLEGLIKK